MRRHVSMPSRTKRESFRALPMHIQEALPSFHPHGGSMVRRFVAIGLIGHLLVPAPAVASLTDGSTLGISRGAMGLADPANGIALPPDVASDGSFTFRFPIELPPGTGGMQPAVALAYRSSAHADSVAGYGWSLDLGTISRSLKRGVPTYDDGLDDFTLDGQDLVFGADGFYHTRRESFLRIQRVGESWEVRSKDGSVARYGTSENSRLRSPNAGNAIFSWQLAEREDSNGNAYSIVYDDTAGSDPGLRHPLRIEYTKHRQAGGSFAFVGPARTAVFVYENRPDVSLRYSAGLEQRLRKRLARVDVSIGSTVIRGYRLIYQQSTDSTRSLLAEIRDEGYPGTGSAARVTKLTYRSNQVSQGWQEATSWTFPPSVSFVTSTFRDGGTRIADVDGDGYPDLFRAVASSSNATTNDGFSGLYRNATGTGFAQRMPFSLPVDQVSGQEMSFVRRANQGGDLPWGTEMLDLDGDGKADVVRAFGLHSLLVGQLAARFQTFRNGPAGWQLIQNQNSNEVATSVAGFVGLGLNSLSVGRLFATSVVAAHGGTSAFADLNGDGLPELVKRVAVRQSGVYAHVERGVARNERGIFAAPVGGRYGICDSTTAECISKSILSSWVVTSGFSIESSQHQGQRLVDLNADGLDDSFGAFRCRNQTVCADDSGLLRYSTFLNDGFDYVEGDSGWLPSLVFEEVDASGVSRDQGVRSFDVNGDGRVDLVQATPTTRNLWLNTGNPGGAWMELGSNSPWNIPAGLEFVDAQGRDRGVRLADLNGDGMVDVIRLQEGADPQVFLNRGVPPDLLASITNPLGGRTEVTYDASNPIPGLKGGLQVVSSILVDSRNQTLAETRFVYEGGLFDTTRREFRGFETITASFHDLSLGATVPLIRTTTTRYHQDEARAGLVRDVVVRDAAGLPWSGTEMTYTEDATPPFASLPRTVTNLEYDGQTSPRRSCTRFEYDDIPSADGNALTYGNLTRRIEFGEVAGGCESLPIPANARVLALGYTTPNTALHLVDRPAWIQLRSGTAGAIVSRSQFYYDNEQGAPYHGNLTRRVDERGLPGEINPETTWVYDGYGNVKEIRDPRLRAGQRSGAATSITYDPVFSTFPIEVVNPLGHRLVLEYGPSSLCSGVAGAVQYPAGAGLVHVERGPNDLAQSPVEGRLRCFDGFGRPLVDRAPGNLAEATWVYVDAPPVSVTRRDRSNPAGPDKRDTRTVVDGLGRPTAVFESAPGLAGTQTARIAVREVRYDAVGRIVNVIDPYYAFDTRPPPTVLSYDPLDRLAEIARPGVGRITRIEQLRGVRSITDPNANTVRQTIDAFGDIVEVEDEAGRTFYKYDAAGRLGSVRDPRNNDTEIAYDRLGQRTTLIDPMQAFACSGMTPTGT
jgi:YD repeat-containing protein